MTGRYEFQLLHNHYEMMQAELKNYQVKYELFKKVIYPDLSQDLCSEVNDLISKKWGLENFFLYLNEENSKSITLYPKCKKNEQNFFPDEIHLTEEKNPLVEAFLKNKTIYFACQDKELLITPMKLMHQVIGVYCFCVKEKRPTEKDLESIESLVQIIAFSVYNYYKTNQKQAIIDKHNHILEINQKIQSTLDLDLIIQSLGIYIAEKIQPDGYFIAMLEEDGENLLMEAAHFQEKMKEIEAVINKTRFQLSKSHVNKICIEKNKVICLTESNLKEYGDNAKSIFEYWKLKNAIFIPIALEDKKIKPIGLICIFNHDSMIAESSVKKLKKILPTYYYPLQNAFIFRKFKDLEKNFKTIEERNKKTLSIFESISQLTSIDLIYEKILEDIFHLFHFDIGLVFIEKNHFLEYAAGSFRKESSVRESFEKVHHYFNSEKGYEISMIDGATAICFIRNNYFYFQDIEFIINNPMSVKDKTGLQILKTPKSLFLAPILKNKEPIGVIQLWSLENKIALSANDQEILNLLCSFIGTAISNAELYSVVEEQKKKLEEKNKIIRSKNQQLMDEIKLAGQIQINLIPQRSPFVEGIKIASLYMPMEDIGGDFYDFIYFKNEPLFSIFISDVSGHGVPAALITSMVKTLIGTSENAKLSTSSFLSYINDKISGQTNGNFLTAFYGILNTQTKKFTYSRGAHNLPLLIRDGNIIELNSRGKMLGVTPGIQYEEVSIQLQTKDKILFYTDGLVEATNPQNLDFESKLHQLLLDNSNLEVQLSLDYIYHNLLEFREDYHFDDDICMILMEIE